MSHRLSRGKRRWIRGLMVRNGYPGWAHVIGLMRAEHPALTGKRARREGRHHDGQKMSEPCTVCGRRTPGNGKGLMEGLFGLCRRCARVVGKTRLKIGGVP